jgi:SAM-dependent methyltransferase
MQENASWFAEEGGCFGPGYLLQYQPMLSHAKTVEQVDFVERVLALKRSARVLDMPCGHGRHAIELAKRGYVMVGVDINSFFLQKAEQKAQQAHVSLTLQKKDMREVSFDREFDAALNLFTSIGYFDSDADDEGIFGRFSCSLKNGGSLLLDFINRDHLVRTFRPCWERELLDGSMLISEPEYDLVLGRCRIRRRIVNKSGAGFQILTNLLYRMYTPTELIKMARKSGLRFREAYGDFSGDALTIDSERAILIFEKP